MMPPSWVCPVLTSGPSCLVGEAWQPCTGEKGLSGLVRLTELRGLAGLLVLKEPDAPLATVGETERHVQRHVADDRGGRWYSCLHVWLLGHLTSVLGCVSASG